MSKHLATCFFSPSFFPSSFLCFFVPSSLPYFLLSFFFLLFIPSFFLFTYLLVEKLFLFGYGCFLPLYCIYPTLISYFVLRHCLTNFPRLVFNTPCILGRAYIFDCPASVFQVSKVQAHSVCPSYKDALIDNIMLDIK